MILSKVCYDSYISKKINKDTCKLYYEACLITDAYTEGIGNFLKNIWKNIKDFFKWIKDYIMLIWNQRMGVHYRNLMMNRKFNLASREYKLTGVFDIVINGRAISVTTKETTLYNLIMNFERTANVFKKLKDIKKLEEELINSMGETYIDILSDDLSNQNSDEHNKAYNELFDIYSNFSKTMQILIKFEKDFDSAVKDVKSTVGIVDVNPYN